MTKFAVYAVPAFGTTEVQDMFDTFAEAEACAVALNGKDDGYDYRVDELVDTNLITDDDIGLLSSLHYYGWEFPGNTWDGIPPEIVKAGLDGLDAFLRIANWSKTKVDPLSVATSDIPF